MAPSLVCSLRRLILPWLTLALRESGTPLRMVHPAPGFNRKSFVTDLVLRTVDRTPPNVQCSQMHLMEQLPSSLRRLPRILSLL